jgi:hypothetical protein
MKGNSYCLKKFLFYPYPNTCDCITTQKFTTIPALRSAIVAVTSEVCKVFGHLMMLFQLLRLHKSMRWEEQCEVRITSNLAEIKTEYFQNTISECYHYISLICLKWRGLFTCGLMLSMSQIGIQGSKTAMVEVESQMAPAISMTWPSDRSRCQLVLKSRRWKKDNQ